MSLLQKAQCVLEVVTSLCVIVGVILVSALLYHTWFHNEEITPRKGDHLPQLAGYPWVSSSHTLVFAVQKGCHFCEDSMPFYRKLADLSKAHKLNARLVMVLPDSAQTAQQMLRDAHVSIQPLAGVALSTLEAGGTPTLILVDSAGKVDDAWVGEQDQNGQASILKSVSR
jgi:hypothetical protein